MNTTSYGLHCSKTNELSVGNVIALLFRPVFKKPSQLIEWDFDVAYYHHKPKNAIR